MKLAKNQNVTGDVIKIVDSMTADLYQTFPHFLSCCLVKKEMLIGHFCKTTVRNKGTLLEKCVKRFITPPISYSIVELVISELFG